jgi:hypothetical protein
VGHKEVPVTQLRKKGSPLHRLKPAPGVMKHHTMGRLVTCRPIANRPRARPEKFLRVCDQARAYRVSFDVPDKPLELGSVTDERS